MDNVDRTARAADPAAMASIASCRTLLSSDFVSWSKM